MKKFSELKGKVKSQLVVAISSKYNIHPSFLTTYIIEEINVYPDKYLMIYIYDDENNKYTFRQDEIYTLNLTILKNK